MTSIDKIRNEYIRGTVQVGQFGRRAVWRENTRGKTAVVWTCTDGGKMISILGEGC